MIWWHNQTYGHLGFILVFIFGVLSNSSILYALHQHVLVHFFYFLFYFYFLSLVVLIIICFVASIYHGVMVFFRDCFDLVHQHKWMLDVVKVMTNMTIVISAGFGGVLFDWLGRRVTLWKNHPKDFKIMTRIQNPWLI